ncbi:hypothetical protein SAMN07250955_101541 [Arboricoccus pini]|uniref:Cytokinin riboside 5'-monophosphate phosphoribohydrolase n=1 Tax=Arboricoccus pini TaxID=1963835 RepID=A0A212QB57_9PROT|nr:TIGR00730 family Rossman fold protein [Arboricoccus pini]SNB56553.1 hypothetical protein SAMN07250955_101541 [Arboricoccus pini]
MPISDDHRHINLPSAREDAGRAKQQLDTPQTRAPTYKLAFADPEFLLRDELRPVRVQLELLKPELELQAQGITSTIVVFGSARIHEPAQARARRQEAAAQAEAAPDDLRLRHAAAAARRAEALAHNYDRARDFARLVSQSRDENGRQRYVIVTGGGPGIMQAANEGAALAGGVSIGHNIVLPHEQAPNPFVTPELCFQFHYFSMRKMHLLTRARALVAFPGGFGTMDELFETLCLIQTGKARPLPVLLFDRAYWTKVIDFEAMVEYGMINEADLSIFSFVESAEEAWKVIEDHYAESHG